MNRYAVVVALALLGIGEMLAPRPAESSAADQVDAYVETEMKPSASPASPSESIVTARSSKPRAMASLWRSRELEADPGEESLRNTNYVLLGVELNVPLSPSYNTTADEGDQRHYRYRAVFGDQEYSVTVTLDANGQIAAMGYEEE